MSAYELDDDMVRIALGATEEGPEERDSAKRYVWANLRKQLSLPRPHKIGAVVATDNKLCAPDLSVFIRWASDVQSDTPWILREELDLTQYSNSELGRIVKVLSEGVDV